MKQLRGGSNFHGRIRDIENGQEVFLECYSNTLYIRVVKGIQERKGEDNTPKIFSPYIAEF